MSNAQAEEKPWNFEREPAHDQTVEVVAKKLWTLDGMVSAVLGKARQAMESRAADEAPIDYERENDLERGIRIGRNFGPRNNGDGGSNAWQKWLVTLSGGLAVMGIGGGIMMYGKLSAIEANQVNQQRQLDQLSATVATLRRSP